MTFTAGQKLAAQDLDQLVSSTTQIIGAAQTTSLQSMTLSAADLTGTSLTFTTLYANTKVTIWGCFDVSYTSLSDTAIGTKLFVGTCLVDGVTLSGEAHFNGTRATVFQEWITTLVAAGSHTIKLQGLVTASLTGACQTNSIHTKWHALVLGP